MHPRILDNIYASGMFNIDLSLYIISRTSFGAGPNRMSAASCVLYTSVCAVRRSACKDHYFMVEFYDVGAICCAVRLL